MANYYLERIAAYAFLDVGYVSPDGKFDINVINEETERELGYAMFGYWHFFTSPDAAEIMTSQVSGIRSRKCTGKTAHKLNNEFPRMKPHVRYCTRLIRTHSETIFARMGQLANPMKKA